MRFLFVHLPKTGGLSLRRMLMASGGLADFDCVHLGSLLRFRGHRLAERLPLATVTLPVYDLAFYMVRDPLQRLWSCYRYFLHGGLNQFRPGRSEQDLAWQKYLHGQASSFRACCANLDLVAQVIPHLQPMTMWLSALPSELAHEVLVGRFETFDLDVHQLLGRLDVDCVELLHENRAAPSAEYLLTVDEAMRDQVQRFYAFDYERYGYPSL